MFKIISVFIISFVFFLLQLQADSIKATVGVGSKHYLPYKLNEDNGGVGIGYEYNIKDNLDLNIDYISFINSYKKNTQFAGLTLDYKPFEYRKVKIGYFGGVVRNKGYCGFYDACKKGMKDTSILPLTGTVFELDNLILKAMVLPNSKMTKIDAIVWVVQ